MHLASKQTPAQVMDAYFLDSRCMLVEIAATLDRFDRARRENPDAEQTDPRIEQLRDAFRLLAEPGASDDRSERLLRSFSDLD